MPRAIEGLGSRIAGEVLAPGAPGYESARKPAMARWQAIRPRAVVMCEGASDVAEALAFARRSGDHVAVRSGGHCFAGRSSTPGMVIDVTPMRSVSVASGLAIVGAGTRLADLYDALDEHGLTIPAGCGPTVGVAGLTLGGGLGILGRKYGLTCDRLVAAQLVLADGRVVDCDEQRHPDLFWALRGAGAGQFGVVTSLVFETVPAPAATAFHVVWPARDAAAVIGAWQSWAPDAADELAASLRLAGDDVLVVNLFGAMLGAESDTVELLDEFVARVGADPQSASHRHLPYRAAKQALVGLGAAEEVESDQPRPMFSKSEFFRRPLPAETIATLVRALDHERGAGESRELNADGRRL
jgi:FAD/FMN-containing dehydrogenase